ncbi:hypothetical protein LTR37_013976 [Vermiconidia calcicola]|uniref:Uncharacterized protein n=1 Tax=Vermiconidia calcicola TaxID=1690605 RepID=A0ACC3MUT6_9PEZI|nr:hypothetical protein LTR37_013976 [Vermiconidia calcicola]
MADFKRPNGNDDLHREETHESALNRVKSAGLLTISPELFERLYLNPQTQVKGDLRKIVGNPTPLGLVGFVVGLMPFACNLMGWQHSNIGPNTGAANIGDYWFIGGPLLLIAGLLEFILGNTFTFVVFVSYAGIFFCLAASFQPFYNAAGAYSESGLNNAEGALTPEFNGSFGFFLIACAILNVLFTICATRINVVFVVIFVGATMGFVLAASSRWCLANGNVGAAGQLVVGVGASWFAISILGWYLLAIQLFTTMGIPAPFPVGDLSGTWAKKTKDAGHEA